MARKKKCLVPICPNTSDNSNKIFLHVPRADFRKQWGKLLNLTVVNKNYVICEDHFDLEKDAANWMFYKTIGEKLKLKKDVLPHKYIESPPPKDLPSCLSDSERKRKMETLRNYHKTKSQSLDQIKMNYHKHFTETFIGEDEIKTEDSIDGLHFVKVEMEDHELCLDSNESQIFYEDSTIGEDQIKTEMVIKDNRIDAENLISVKTEDVIENSIDKPELIYGESIIGEDQIKTEIVIDENGMDEDNSISIKTEEFSFGSLEFHQNETNSEREEQLCNFCDYSTGDPEDLNRHVDFTHIKVCDLRCYLCDYHATEKSQLRHHMNHFHLYRNRYKCNFCSFVGNRNEDLEKHLNSAHRKMKPQYKCHLCDYTSGKKHLKIHFDRVHSRVGKFKCKLCHSNSDRGISLKTHENWQSSHARRKNVETLECEM